jgi:hypothetical protein
MTEEDSTPARQGQGGFRVEGGFRVQGSENAMEPVVPSFLNPDTLNAPHPHGRSNNSALPWGRMV